MCTVRLTEVNKFQREETGQWEKNEREVYTGQWMLCEAEPGIPDLADHLAKRTDG